MANGNGRKSTNVAESSFSRARRAEFGTYHHLSPTYLDFYAGEISWRENRRRTNDLEALKDLFRLAFNHPVSRVMKGYWQHWRLPAEQREREEIRWARVFSSD